MPKPVTLQDIADQLGISKVSVSKALRGQADIGKVTTARVINLAEKLGYRPNILARKLSAKHTRTIGLVVPKIAHHFLTQAIDAIYNRANENHYEIVMMVSEENAELEARHIETLLSMRVDGLLVSVTEQTSQTTIFEKVRASSTPLVFFDRVMEDLGFTCISSADRDGAADLVNYAIRQGYRNIGHLGGYQSVSIGLHRYEGYLDALREHALTMDPEHVVFGGFSRADGYTGMQTIHQSGNLPEILFTVTYPVALGVLKYAQEHDLHIPNDMDLICFGSSDYNSFVVPSLTGINPPAQEIGSTALEHLLGLIETPDQTMIKNVIVPVEIVYAETCLNHLPQNEDSNV